MKNYEDREQTGKNEEKLIMTEIVATNVVTSRVPATPTTCAKKKTFTEKEATNIVARS